MRTNKTLVSFELNDEALENVYGGGRYKYSIHNVTIYKCNNCGNQGFRPGNKMGAGPLPCQNRICNKAPTFKPIQYIPPLS